MGSIMHSLIVEMHYKTKLKNGNLSSMNGNELGGIAKVQQTGSHWIPMNSV
jgi:hypothetical protein